jgi:protein SFI1
MKKWKGIVIRHVEELSLMESYQDVKREGDLVRSLPSITILTSS